MSQTSDPAIGTSENSALASFIKLVPITGKTLLTIAKPPTEATNSVLLPEPSEPWEYTIGPGDVLSIVVWDHPQLTIPAGPQRTPQEAGNWVGPDGSIFYPYIGSISVEGKTIREVREAISEGLRSVIPNPQVDVSIARFSSQRVQVTGAVASPGAVPGKRSRHQNSFC